MQLPANLVVRLSTLAEISYKGETKWMGDVATKESGYLGWALNGFGSHTPDDVSIGEEDFKNYGIAPPEFNMWKLRIKRLTSLKICSSVSSTMQSCVVSRYRRHRDGLAAAEAGAILRSGRHYAVSLSFSTSSIRSIL